MSRFELDAPIVPDDLRFGERLTPGISVSQSAGGAFTGTFRTCEWNTPDDSITLRSAFRHTGLDPEYWVIGHVAEYAWTDADGSGVVAYEITATETDSFVAHREPGETA